MVGLANGTGGWMDSLWTRTFDQSADDPWQFGNRYPDSTPEHYRSQRFVIQIQFMTAMISKPISPKTENALLSSYTHEVWHLEPSTMERPSKSTPDSHFLYREFIAQSGNS